MVCQSLEISRLCFMHVGKQKFSNFAWLNHTFFSMMHLDEYIYTHRDEYIYTHRYTHRDASDVWFKYFTAPDLAYVCKYNHYAYSTARIILLFERISLCRNISVDAMHRWVYIYILIDRWVYIYSSMHRVHRWVYIYILIVKGMGMGAFQEPRRKIIP